MHNALQGHKRSLTDHEKEIYLTYSTRNAHLLDEEYDLIVAHDSQPLAITQFYGRGQTRWAWRCHLDTSEPNPELWDYLRPYLDDYDGAVFTTEDFVPPGLPISRVEIIPPSIDPENPKIIELPSRIAERILGWLGVGFGKPLVTQVSRFDPWKDQPGVIEAYRMVKDEVPDLKLALVGSMALEDPEGWEVYRQIKEAASEDPDIDIFTNLTGVSNVEVNAFQRFSDVCVQKSISEGFGLVVSETLCKSTPMVAGEAGGIPMQMPGGVGGFLVGFKGRRSCRIHTKPINHVRAGEDLLLVSRRGRSWWDIRRESCARIQERERLRELPAIADAVRLARPCGKEGSEGVVTR